MFATTAINAAGADGLLYGNPGLLAKQAVGAIAPLLYAAALTAVILKVIDVTIGLRVHAATRRGGSTSRSMPKRPTP